MEQKGLEERLAELRNGNGSSPDRLAEFLELAESAYLTYKTALSDEKRELLEILTSNRRVDGKNAIVALRLPFAEVAKRAQTTNGAARGN